MRGAAPAAHVNFARLGISIHAPHAGSGTDKYWLKNDGLHFNPRSPCGERHFIVNSIDFDGKFQSTLPMRGAAQNS